MDLPEDVRPIVHSGKKVKVKWLGGESHGQEGVLRRPIKEITFTAAPPRYKGNNFYDANVGSLHYDQYHLKAHGDQLYYVHESWLDDFPNNIDMPYETTNQRLMREEKERGGPIDLVESPLADPETRRVMNQNIVGRCNKCLRVSFDEKEIGRLCGKIKVDNKTCMGYINSIETFKKEEPHADYGTSYVDESASHGGIVARRERRRALSEQELAQQDFEQHGIAFLVDGKRVDPRKVKMIVRTKNPLTISLKDILDGRNQ